MDSYSHTSSNSSSSKSKPLPSFHSSLHSVRKPPAKLMKKPIAPLPPTPPRVYKVDSINFKAVVQRLTSQPRRLQDVAPPPLNLSTSTLSDQNIATPLCLFPSPGDQTQSCDTFGELVNLEAKPGKVSEGFGALSPLGFGLSPSSLSWCSFALTSPGSLSSWGQSPVL